MVSVNDVARYILEHQGEISTMKLQKLVYYAQAWSLVWDEKPLFPSRIEAWANGPVIRDLYECHRGHFNANSELFPGDSAHLSTAEKETIDAVLEAYGDLSGQQLSDLAHGERPWREARENVPPGAPSSNEVNLEVMQYFYSALQAAAAV